MMFFTFWDNLQFGSRVLPRSLCAVYGPVVLPVSFSALCTSRSYFYGSLGDSVFPSIFITVIQRTFAGCLVPGVSDFSFLNRRSLFLRKS